MTYKFNDFTSNKVLRDNNNYNFTGCFCAKEKNLLSLPARSNRRSQMNEKEIQGVKQRFGIIGTNSQLNRAIEVALQVAKTDLSVLVTGESGVGKEFFPQIIHTFSSRKHGPYFAINCGAIPEGTIDSELFGHEKGAYTDAKSERKG